MELIAGQEWVSQTDGRRIVHVRDGLVRYWVRNGNWYLNSTMSQSEDEFREWIKESRAWLVEPRLRFFLQEGQIWKKGGVTRRITALHYGSRNVSWYEQVAPTRGMFAATGSTLDFEEWTADATMIGAETEPPRTNREWIKEVLKGLEKYCVIQGTPSSTLLVPINRVEEVLLEKGPSGDEDDD